MNRPFGKREIILAVIAICLIGASFWMKPTVQQTGETDPVHVLLAKGLKAELNEINAIELTQGEAQKTTITRDADGIWRIKELYDYPASTANIRKALLYLSQSELREKKTDDQTKWDRLGLDHAHATHVKLKKGEETTYHLQLGKVTADATGTYVRLGNSPDTYAASGRLELKANPHEWLFYDLFSIDRARVKRIRYEFTGKKDYEYVRTAPEAEMSLLPPPEGKLKDRPVPLNPSYYFERLQFTDVMPETKITSSVPNETALETFDGLVITVRFYEIDQRNWAQFSARVDTSLRDESVKDLRPLATVQQEANAINERTAGWLYELGQFNYTQLRSSYFDLAAQ
jgi:Domain of unknown function (DUF4340)